MIRVLRRPIILTILCLALLGVVGCENGRQAVESPQQQVAAAVEPTATNTIAPENPTATVVEESPVAPAPITLPPATPTDIDTATAALPPPPSPSPTASASAVHTDTPAPPPTETAVPLPLPEWLSYLNRFRAMANLPPLSDQESYTLGSRLHSRYMVGNDEPIAHSEEEEKPFFDEAGDQAARNANLFATSQTEATYMWSINFWVSAPFHLIGILDPALEVVGYGDYKEEGGDTQMAAVLDIGSHPAGTTVGTEYPIMFPAEGSETWVVRHSLFEWPYPFDGCPGFSVPTGPPIILLLGDGSGTPNVSSHRFAKGDQPLESCLFDETSYRNNDPYAEQAGRKILDGSDAVVIMPREPLAIDETFTAQVTADGETYTWSFSTRRGPDP